MHTISHIMRERLLWQKRPSFRGCVLGLNVHRILW